ncbi:MAG: hypothetical protein WCN92_02345 [Eubacteriales bacterium]
MSYFKTRVKLLKKLLCLVFVLIITVIPAAPFAGAAGKTVKGTSYPYIFVSGYAGWGNYDKFNDTLPYWGRLNGDLIAYLNKQGYKSYAASINPLGSAWDRACELYAQLTGTVVDYGEVHSAKYHHFRYGYDFSKEPLIQGWGKKDKNGNLNKINIIAHSFGGATSRLFAELMANGSKEEIKGTKIGKVSGFFKGSKADWIYSISTFASPHDGTDSVLIFSPLEMMTVFGLTENLGSLQQEPVVQYASKIGKSMTLTNINDTGLYDLTIDGASELNKKISIIKNIYYFSTPSDATKASSSSDTRIPDTSVSDPLFLANIYMIGRSKTVTEKGTVVDEKWFSNDGVVNTISSIAPKNEPRKTFNVKNIKPGIWNVMTTFKGDHAAIIGGLSHKVDINSLYLNQIKLVNSI